MIVCFWWKIGLLPKNRLITHFLPSLKNISYTSLLRPVLTKADWRLLLAIHLLSDNLSGKRDENVKTMIVDQKLFPDK